MVRSCRCWICCVGPLLAGGGLWDRRPKADDGHLTEFSTGGFRLPGRTAAIGQERSLADCLAMAEENLNRTVT